MKLVSQQYDVAAVDSLQPHPDNPRRGDLDVISRSVDANGFYGAVVVQQGTNTILAGKHRWEAAKLAGAAEIPVLYVDVNDSQARRIVLTDNRTSDLATYDDEALLSLLVSISDEGDLVGTGFDEADLLRLQEAQRIPDFEPEDETGRLDDVKPKECPSCGYQWHEGRDGSIEPV